MTGVAQTGSSKTVTVAAIQCSSVMGETERNISMITSLIGQAADAGAKIVVLPECSVQGYMDPTVWRSWSKTEEGANEVARVAQQVPGPATKVFAALAQKYGIYICIGLVESAEKDFFNSQLLFGSDGRIIAHHRKKHLWTPGDSAWCSPGDLPVQVVETEYGKLGLMICYDFHVLPELLAEKEVDIVLYSVGWYGPNEKRWFSEALPKKTVVPHGFHMVVANWTSASAEITWPGRGFSCILNEDGEVLAMSHARVGASIVIGELPIR